MAKNITQLIKGLFKDKSAVDTAKGTYQYALNTVKETELGDMDFLSNEEANEACFNLPEGYVPLGKVYIGDGETAILSTSETDGRDEIGIVDKDCIYTTKVNAKLGFKITNQIDLTYRLRGGCDKTIYWVDGKNNPPMNYIFSKPEEFKTGGFWDKNKFTLESSFTIFPEFTKIKVVEGLGNIKSGSISVGIQYVDESLNPTPILTTTSAVNIYVDSFGANYTEVQGSIVSDMVAFNFPATNKAIEVTLNLDTSYKFYRLAFIEYTSGNGELTSIKYTDIISTTSNVFLYTGDNYLTEGTETEILTGGKSLSSGDSIEQIDNRLVIANTSGQTAEMCGLQRIVSQIQADLIIKQVSGNSITPGNTKSPTNHFEAVGYMPGEIYSFGLVPIFEDFSEGPVYHIPGKNPSYGESHIFSPASDVYPMSINNTSINRKYLDNDTCGGDSYWGVDSNGDELVGATVRHHRFPYRSLIGVPMVEETSSNTTSISVITGVLNAVGTIDTPCTQEEFDNGECSPFTVADPFQIKMTFEIDGNTKTYYFEIDPENYKTPTGQATINYSQITEDYTGLLVTNVSLEEEQSDGSWEPITEGDVSTKGLTYSSSFELEEKTKTKNDYKLNVYGIKFSNIDISAMNAVSSKTVIGYHIVRNERKEVNKTILDSVVLTPCVNSRNNGRNLWGKNPDDTIGDYHKTFESMELQDNYLANGLLMPNFDRGQIKPTYSSGALEIGSENFLNRDRRISKKFFGFINPEFKFNDIKYENVTRIKQEGVFNPVYQKYNSFITQDVDKESSYNKDVHRNKFDDDDGYSLRGGTRDTKLSFSLDIGAYNFLDSEIDDISYLNAIDNKAYSSLPENLWNLSADNKTGILSLTDGLKDTPLRSLPYVYFERDIADPYDNFRSLPYYKITHKIEETSEVAVFEGDTYISPVRYFSSLFLGNQNAFRVDKNSVWKIVLGSVLTAVVAVASIWVPALAAALPFTLGLIMAGIDEQKLINAYSEEYEKGLYECLIDADTFNGFKYYPSQDDEIHWFGEVLTDLWFESAVNTSLRHEMTDGEREYFMGAPGIVSGSNHLGYNTVHTVNWGIGKDAHLLKDDTKLPPDPTTRHLSRKTLVNDANHNQNKRFIGHPTAEMYDINLDFDRMNKQKIFFHLGIEYDCCSDCQEDFPHRVWYSEQSFQEELSDNYKIFLPLNYRDIEGETGRITDLFKMNNNLYIHTEGALWHLPQNYQERVTDQLTTFIGTGEFFAIPPRKILDDEQSSGGTQHKWATNKNEHGVFFISESERKIYRFDGKNLRSIVTGLSKWFLDNIKLKVNKNFKNKNNPSNPKGVGFISIYDAEKERVIFTKKDYSPVDGTDIIFDPDLGYYTQEGEICGEGYTYDPEKQVCYKEEEVEKQPIGESISVNSVGTSSHGFATPAIYTSYNSDGTADVDPLSSTGYTFENITNLWWIGGVVGGGIPSQRYVNLLAKWVTGANLGTWYGGVKLVDVPSTKTYYVALAADDEFRFSVDGVVILTSDAEGMNTQHNRPFGTPFVKIHIYPIELEAGCRLIKVEGLNKGSDGLFSASILDNTYSEIVNSTSQADLNEIYSTQHITELFEDGFTMACPEDSISQGKGLCDKCLARDEKPLNITRVDFEDKRYFNDSSWTMSFDPIGSQDMPNGFWISWHSYMPRFYLKNEGKFYSWQNDLQDNSFWEHNIKGLYQKFYGENFPFVIEYTALSEPLQTKIWDDIILHTEAKKYDLARDQFYDVRDVTFNKGIFYNTRQCTGELNLKVKDTDLPEEDYMMQQVVNLAPGTIILDRNERNWSLNDIRDIRIDYNSPIFDSSLASLQSSYFTDKILNVSSLDVNKDWDQQESLRDKYLVVRLIFDTFEDVKLLMNYSIENEQESSR